MKTNTFIAIDFSKSHLALYVILSIIFCNIISWERKLIIIYIVDESTNDAGIFKGFLYVCYLYVTSFIL